jgi:hypothetical protein
LQPSETALAYAAGVIDSDGHITASRKLGKQRLDGSRSYVYAPRIGVGQIKSVVPEWFVVTFGVGAVFEVELRPGRVRAFLWQAYSAEAAFVVRLLVPYLLLKRRQASLVIELAELLAARKARVPLSAEDEARRMRLYEQIRSCQQRWSGFESLAGVHAGVT